MSLAGTTALVQAFLLGWAGIELLLWLRNRSGKTAPDLTFALVVASVAAGLNLAFRAAHSPGTVIGGGLAVATVGLIVLVLGVALRTWAILALGRFFKFVVVIQDGHHVVDSARTGLFVTRAIAAGCSR